MCQSGSEVTLTTIRERKTFFLPENAEEVASSLKPSASNGKPNLNKYSPSHTKMPMMYPPRSRSTTPTKDIKKSMSFGGFDLFITDEDKEVTNQEIATLIDPKKRELNVVTKQQIKIFAQKYKDVPNDNPPEASQPWYKELFKHSQTPHLILMVVVAVIAFRLFPDSRRSAHEASTVTRLLYVSSVSVVFGAQFWMTFVNGLALFFSVPRHVFSQVQAVMFPLYFAINALFSFISIITYTQHHPSHLWDFHQMMQAGFLLCGFMINLLIKLYLAPALTNLITIKLAIEREAGMGTEIGSSGPGNLARCPHYMRLFRAFRRTHTYIALGNMTAMAVTWLHMYYLAVKLCSAAR